MYFVIGGLKINQLKNSKISFPLISLHFIEYYVDWQFYSKYF